jgi:hypothetical protein
MGWDNPFEGRWVRRGEEKIPSAEARAWLIETYGEPTLFSLSNINLRRENSIEVKEKWDLCKDPGGEAISISWFKEANFKIKTIEIGLEEVQQACTKRIRLYTAIYEKEERERKEEEAKYLPSGKLKPIKKSK